MLLFSMFLNNDISVQTMVIWNIYEMNQYTNLHSNPYRSQSLYKDPQLWGIRALIRPYHSFCLQDHRCSRLALVVRLCKWHIELQRRGNIPKWNQGQFQRISSRPWIPSLIVRCTQYHQLQNRQSRTCNTIGSRWDSRLPKERMKR